MHPPVELLGRIAEFLRARVHEGTLTQAEAERSAELAGMSILLGNDAFESVEAERLAQRLADLGLELRSPAELELDFE